MKKYQSFGLIEVVISAGILAMFLGGLLALSTMSIRGNVSAQKRLQAANLAREAIQQVRQIRDSAKNSSEGSWEGMKANGCCYCLGIAGAKYFPSTTSNCDYRKIVGCAAGKDYQKIQIGNNSFIYASGCITMGDIQIGQFGRRVRITYPDDNVARVWVEVIWKEGGQTRSLNMYSIISNWLP